MIVVKSELIYLGATINYFVYFAFHYARIETFWL